jgi:carboxylate-amine ligase
LPEEDDYLVYNYNRFQACRFGMDGMMVNPKTREQISIREDVLATLARAPAPCMLALESLAGLDEIERTAAHDGNHATWLRQRFAEHGSVQGVVRSAADLLRT